MYQANHLGHVSLTLLLLNNGQFLSHARIFNLSSCSSYAGNEPDPRNVNSHNILANYEFNIRSPLSFGDVMTLYARSKISQVIWTMALQRRLGEREGWKNISIHARHRGQFLLLNSDTLYNKRWLSRHRYIIFVDSARWN
jgi:NAD(P)-dependent dehydrogenase (short-subunit alcohol dehydrogenase family)